MSEDLDRRYAELERSLEPQRARSIARGPIGLIAVCLALALAVGTVAAIDIRRLQTPRGAALGWTSAAVFGDCESYRRLSFGDLDARTCLELRTSTQQARETAAGIGIDVLSVQQRGRQATVRVQVRRGEDTAQVDLPLRRKGDGWAVELTAEVCAVIGCA